MSRSFKKPIVKVKATGDSKLKLHRQKRRSVKNALRSQDLDENFDLPNEKTIVNDYDYVDYINKNAGDKEKRK